MKLSYKFLKKGTNRSDSNFQDRRYFDIDNSNSKNEQFRTENVSNHKLYQMKMKPYKEEILYYVRDRKINCWQP